MLAGRFTWPDVPLTWVMAQFRLIEVEVIATAGSDGPRAGPRILRRQRLEPMTHLGGTSELMIRSTTPDSDRMGQDRWAHLGPLLAPVRPQNLKLFESSNALAKLVRWWAVGQDGIRPVGTSPTSRPRVCHTGGPAPLPAGPAVRSAPRTRPARPKCAAAIRRSGNQPGHGTGPRRMRPQIGPVLSSHTCALS